MNYHKIDRARLERDRSFNRFDIPEPDLKNPSGKVDWSLPYQYYSRLYYEIMVRTWIEDNGRTQAPPYTKLERDARELAELYTTEAINIYESRDNGTTT